MAVAKAPDFQIGSGTKAENSTLADNQPESNPNSAGPSIGQPDDNFDYKNEELSKLFERFYDKIEEQIPTLVKTDNEFAEIVDILERLGFPNFAKGTVIFLYLIKKILDTKKKKFCDFYCERRFDFMEWLEKNGKLPLEIIAEVLNQLFEDIIHFEGELLELFIALIMRYGIDNICNCVRHHVGKQGIVF